MTETNPIDPPLMSDGEHTQWLEAEVERLRAELKGSYGELIALSRICNHSTSTEMTREKLRKLEAAEAGGDSE